MRDNFKEYVKAQQEEFEFPFDAGTGWKDFQKRHPAVKKHKMSWWIAASITVLLVFGFWVVKQQEETRELTEWEEVESFYQNQIDQMTILVMNLSQDQEILYDLEQMDRAFVELKADLKDDAANEEVLEAMMNHYRLKVKILEKMLEEMRDENDENENISFL